jgi:hypothetical protein
MEVKRIESNGRTQEMPINHLNTHDRLNAIIAFWGEGLAPMMIEEVMAENSLPTK